jgi:hypothetical protein
MTEILDAYVGKTVRVKIQGLIIVGKLLNVKSSGKPNHDPNVLVVETKDGKLILRSSWESLTEVRGDRFGK